MKPYASRISRISVGFLFLLVTHSPWASASTSDTINALEIQFDKIRSSLISTIESLPDHPDFLESGSLDATLQTAISGDLANLQNQLQQQAYIMDGKRQSVETNSVLSASDKEELKADLARDRKPLTALGDKVSTFISAITDLRKSQLPRWKETYDSYKDTLGTPKATEKLQGFVDVFCAPYGSPKITPQPTIYPVAVSPRPRATTTPMVQHAAHPHAEGEGVNNFQTTIPAASSGLRMQNFEVPVAPVTVTAPVPSPSRAGIIPHATPSPTPQEGFFARKYKGFQIFPQWFWTAVVIGVLLTILAVKWDNDIFSFLLMGAATITAIWWLLNLGWRALVILFS